MPFLFKRSVNALVLASFLSSVAMGSSIASAEEHPVGVASKLSTLGIGGEFNYAVSDQVELMLGMNFYDFNFDLSENHLDYKGTLQLNNLLSGVRFRPFSNYLYVGGGVGLNNNNIRLSVKPNSEGNYVFNGKTYDSEQIGFVRANGDFSKLSLLLLAGVESKPKNTVGLSFFGEIGGFIGGHASFENDILCSKVGTSTCDRVKADFNVERDEVSKKLRGLYVYPLVGIGSRYRF